MIKTVPIEFVRARESDPSVAAQAQERADAASRLLEPHRERMKALAERAQKEPDFAKKFRLLREIADYVADAMSGLVPCRAGCSHCCRIPVQLTRVEAGVIAHENGFRVTNPAKYSVDGNPAYTGTPCPFLVENQCSIYETRPMACRIHYNMDVDALLCELRGEVVHVPYFNNFDYQVLMFLAVGQAQAPRLADIREYFPNGGKR